MSAGPVYWIKNTEGLRPRLLDRAGCNGIGGARPSRALSKLTLLPRQTAASGRGERVRGLSTTGEAKRSEHEPRSEANSHARHGAGDGVMVPPACSGIQVAGSNGGMARGTGTRTRRSAPT